VHYEVDRLGGVHYKHDQAFREQVSAAIASLQPARYTNARAEFERARTEMLKPVPDGKQAVRSVFSAAEGLFKLTFPGQQRLTSDPAQKLIAGHAPGAGR
jgi:hypothetical protein